MSAALPFRRTHIFFTLFGAYLFLKGGVRCSWLLRGAPAARELGSAGLDLALSFATLAAGVLLVGSGLAVAHRRRAALFACASGLACFAVEVCGGLLAWVRPLPPEVKSGALVSHALAGGLAMFVMVRGERLRRAAGSSGGPVPRNPPCPPQLDC